MEGVSFDTGFREPSNLDVTKLFLTGQASSQAKIVTGNSKFFFWKNLSLTMKPRLYRSLVKKDMQRNY